MSAPVVDFGPANDASLSGPDTSAENPVSNPDSFTFVRVRYHSSGGYGESWYRHEGRDWERWETDFPRAELNLLFRLNQLTSMRVNPDPIVLRLTEPALLDHPFILHERRWMAVLIPRRGCWAEPLPQARWFLVDR